MQGKIISIIFWEQLTKSSHRVHLCFNNYKQNIDVCFSAITCFLRKKYIFARINFLVIKIMRAISGAKASGREN